LPTEPSIHATSDNPTEQQLWNTLFTRIINREIPASIIYEDEQVLAFRAGTAPDELATGLIPLTQRKSSAAD
jgi:hypothetical protein